MALHAEKKSRNGKNGSVAHHVPVFPPFPEFAHADGTEGLPEFPALSRIRGKIFPAVEGEVVRNIIRHPGMCKNECDGMGFKNPWALFRQIFRHGRVFCAPFRRIGHDGAFLIHLVVDGVVVQHPVTGAGIWSVEELEKIFRIRIVGGPGEAEELQLPGGEFLQKARTCIEFRPHPDSDSAQVRGEQFRGLAVECVASCLIEAQFQRGSCGGVDSIRISGLPVRVRFRLWLLSFPQLRPSHRSRWPQALPHP